MLPQKQPQKGPFPPASLNDEYLADGMMLKAEAGRPWVTRTLATVWIYHLCLMGLNRGPHRYSTDHEGVRQKAGLRLFFLEAETMWEVELPADLERETCILLFSHPFIVQTDEDIAIAVSESPVVGEIALPCLPELRNSLQFHTVVISHFKE